MKIYFSTYQLKKKNRLNSQDISETQNGALLKVTDGSAWGVADLCPKPELGDETLEVELKTRGLLFLRSIELAIEDMLARKNEKSLLLDKKIKNNFLITDYQKHDLDKKEYVGCTVKIKGDQQIDQLSWLLNTKLKNSKIRLDFNSCLTVDEYLKFVELLSSDCKSRIEYVEDPTPMSEHWLMLKKSLPIAYDFQYLLFDKNLADHRIIKPSRQRIPNDLNNVTLTSAMEHPVGLAHGLRLAQQCAQNESGFMVLDQFEDIGFHSYFEINGCYMNFSKKALDDFGIGMSAELKELSWKEL